MKSQNVEDSDQPIYDVIIVGAGPCGLATAARLREKHPSALFTDEEQARYSWMAKHAHQASIKNKRNGRVKNSQDTGQLQPSILVLDQTSTEWMSRWNELFRTFEISHLRSPMFFHPDPSDRDALLAYVHNEGRTGEMEEIAGCVGKEVSKHKKKKRAGCRSRSAKPVVEIDERDRKDYFTPSTSCFKDFCQSCWDRYQLHEHVIRQETVRDIDYDVLHNTNSNSQAEKVFHICTDHTSYLARTVVLAIGGGTPVIPSPFPQNLPPGATHAMDIKDGRLIDDRLQVKIRAQDFTNVLVVGGGLTSAQIVDAAIRKGVSRVHLMMRGPWKVKPFDIDLSWMSKFKNHQRSVFWTADSFEERIEQVRQARNGGSMTPRFARVLKRHVQDGKLTVHTNTTIITQDFCPESEAWTITTDPASHTHLSFDHIYFATGAHTSIHTLPLLRTMNSKHPIEICSGLPALTDDLMWKSDIPLFCAGKLATLQLGPGAGNLEGARLGAERIAWAIEEFLAKSVGDKNDDLSAVTTGIGDEERYASGIGSKFAALGLE